MRHLLILAILVVISSCYTERKARDQFSKAAIAYPIIPAEYCADEYPAKAKTDSTQYKNSKAIIDTLNARLEKLKRDSLISDSEREILIVEIERIKNSIPNHVDCDSITDAVYRLAAREKQRGDQLQKAYDNLSKASTNVKPVIDTVVDNAALDLCNIERRAISLSFEAEQKRADKYQGQAKKRGMIMWGLIAGLLIAAGTWIYFKIRKPKT